MLNILIVEDDPLLAETVKSLVELNPRFQVTALANDLDSAVAAIEERRPDLALVDLQLANGSSGYAVAARLHDFGIACLFTTGRAPGFAVRDLAIGCLQKPYREEDLVRALSEAEDILKGRQKLVLRQRLPEPLEIYGDEDVADEPAFTLAISRRTSWLAKLKKLVRRPSSFRSAAPVTWFPGEGRDPDSPALPLDPGLRRGTSLLTPPSVSAPPPPRAG